MLLGAYKKILSRPSKTCNEAVWGDLVVEPLALRRAKSKVLWYSKLLGKNKNSYCRQVFDKEWGKCKLQGRRRKEWKKCAMDITSDMQITVSSLDSKEALININAMNMHKHNNCHPLHHHYVERVGLVISQGPLPWQCLLYNLQGLGPQPWYLLHAPMPGHHMLPIRKGSPPLALANSPGLQHMMHY